MTDRRMNALIGALCWLALGAGITWISYSDAAGSAWRKSALSVLVFAVVGVVGVALLRGRRDRGAARAIFGPGVAWGLVFGAIGALGYLLFMNGWGAGQVVVISGVTFGLVAGTAFGVLAYLVSAGAGLRPWTGAALGAVAGVAFVALLFVPELLVARWRADISAGETLQIAAIYIPLGLVAGALSVLGRSQRAARTG